MNKMETWQRFGEIIAILNSGCGNFRVGEFKPISYINQNNNTLRKQIMYTYGQFINNNTIFYDRPMSDLINELLDILNNNNIDDTAIYNIISGTHIPRRKKIERMKQKKAIEIKIEGLDNIDDTIDNDSGVKYWVGLSDVDDNGHCAIKYTDLMTHNGYHKSNNNKTHWVSFDAGMSKSKIRDVLMQYATELYLDDNNDKFILD